MSKAVTEVAIGAAAIGAAVLMPGIGAGLAWMTLGMQNAIIGSLVSLGASSIMSGIADALHADQGGLAVGVTTPIGPWGYIYGTQKVGGVEIFRESNNSQGTSNDKQLHRIYVLACHPCVGDSSDTWQLRIDGKQVQAEPSSTSYGWNSVSPTQSTSAISSISRSNGVVTAVLATPIGGQNGLTMQFTGVADNSFNGTWTVTQPSPGTLTYVCGGPDATTSGGQAQTTYPDYKDKIYIQFLNGSHTATFQGPDSPTASGTTWTATDLCLGRTLVYVRMGYDSSVFPSSIPNVSFVLQGKNNILDPRTGTRGFSNNAALCIADFLSQPATKGGFGMIIGTDIPTAQLIAAANVCDEEVALAAGGFTPRYTCDTFIQLNTPRGTNLKNLLSSCAGRISYQGGQYYIAPAGWVSPTLTLSDADLVGPIKWRPRFSIRDTCNAVKGTYVSPENAYQQADVPAYMQDADHGYVTDPWLAEDNGERICKEASFPCTGSSAIAQRLEKIALLRTRFQGRGTLQCSLRAYQAVALDVVQFTHPRYTWVNEAFEVLATRFVLDTSGGAPRPVIELDIAETDPSIYDWEITEQLTPTGYKQPNNVGVRVCAPPEDVTCYSGPGETVNGIVYPSTINVTSSGVASNSIYVRWNQPNDANVVLGGHLEVQWQPLGSTVWQAISNISPGASSIFIHGVTDCAQYKLQVSAVNCANVPSAWVISGPVTVSNSISSLAYSGIPVAPAGTLTAQGMPDGTAQITVLNFTATVGAAYANCTPTPDVLPGLNQAQLYYVYYVDPSFLGGDIVPVATQNPADFENKTGYFLIGSIITPTYSPRYQPTACSDVGSSATISPAAAYDNNVNTDAVVSGAWWVVDESDPPVNTYVWASTVGNCTWFGFPNVTLAAPATLYVIAGCASSGTGTPACSVIATVGGTPTTMESFSAATAEQSYTLALPAGTNLSTVSVTAVAASTHPSGLPRDSYGQGGGAALELFEVYVQ